VSGPAASKRRPMAQNVTNVGRRLAVVRKRGEEAPWPRVVREQSGDHVAAVVSNLRHRDPRMTANLYGHLPTDYLRAEIDRLGFDAETDSAEGATELRVPLMSPSPESRPHARERLPRNVPPPFMLSEGVRDLNP